MRQPLHLHERAALKRDGRPKQRTRSGPAPRRFGAPQADRPSSANSPTRRDPGQRIFRRIKDAIHQSRDTMSAYSKRRAASLEKRKLKDPRTGQRRAPAKRKIFGRTRP